MAGAHGEALNAGRYPAHRADLVLVKAQGLSRAGQQRNVLPPIGNSGADQVVVVLDLQRDDAIAGGGKQVFVVAELADRDNGADLVILIQRQRVNDGPPSGIR
tara:strand:+ start:274 stop:582 length:309 start_codon:yes stop_codon:yes gene_type:complete